MSRIIVQGRKTLAGLIGGCLMLYGAPIAAESFDPTTHEGVDVLVNELAEKGLDRDWLMSAMRGAEFRQEVLDAMSGAAERRLRWDEYRDIFIQPKRINAGIEFIEAHRGAFERAEREYGIEPEIIAAIIGIETFYGRYTGQHKVIDSLSTLAFHHPQRGGFFRGELVAFLQIASEAGIDPQLPQGSYAGAMGYPQFIPTSYQAYAVDFDQDGIRDLWNNPVDAIGSVANYFSRHGWRTGEPIIDSAEGPALLPAEVDFNRTAEPYERIATLSDQGIHAKEFGQLDDDARVIPLALEFADDPGRIDYKLGHHNFYVITRYNHSHLYAMAVLTLAERIGANIKESP